MKNIISKNNISIDYCNVSEKIDTTAFSELTYFLVSYKDNDKKQSYFLDEKQFECLIEGKMLGHDWHDSPMLIKKDAIELIKKYGLLSMSHLYAIDNQKEAPNRAHFFSTSEQDLFNPAPEFVLIKLVKNVQNKFAWLDLAGNLFSEPFRIDGSPISELHDTKYRLDEFAEELSQRNDIAFITHTGRWEEKGSTLLFAPLKGDEKSIGGIISEMTHHIEEGESMPEEKEELNLVYYPNKDNVKRLIDFDSRVESQKPENKFTGNYFVERHIINEILGGAKHLINPPVKEEIKVRKFRN